MFTGIIENVGTIRAILNEQTNKKFYIKAEFVRDLKIDQSIAHNGVCLTVVEFGTDESFYKDCYAVIAVEETIGCSSLGRWALGDTVNLERSLPANGRIDGHFVQGHVDTIGTVKSIEDRDGSWYFSFNFPSMYQNLIVPKGSIAIDGVSLTVVSVQESSFNVAIIPYTYQNTNFNRLKIGDPVNLEFDILGKYIHKMIKNQNT